MTRHDFKGRCHCGAVQFSVTLSDRLSAPSRCDCSFCARRGAVALTAPKDGIRFLSGEGNLTLYQFGTHTARHFFCKTCGIYTHHQRRSNPEELSINAACLDGVTPFDFERVVVFDGRSHPADAGGAEGIAGWLSFAPADAPDA